MVQEEEPKAHTSPRPAYKVFQLRLVACLRYCAPCLPRCVSRLTPPQVTALRSLPPLSQAHLLLISRLRIPLSLPCPLSRHEVGQEAYHSRASSRDPRVWALGGGSSRLLIGRGHGFMHSPESSTRSDCITVDNHHAP